MRDPRHYLDLLRYHRRRSAAFAEHDYHDVYLATRRRLEAALGRPAQGWRMLDVGCGQRVPATLLFTAAGNAVTGIDTELVAPHFELRAVWRLLRTEGGERAAKTAVRQLLFDPAYYGRLEELAGRRLPREHLDVRQLSITSDLSFPDRSFDAVISNAVFEHVVDVPAALERVRRLLRVGGAFHIAIHLFPSLSGGHHMRWAFPDTAPPADVPPWDHLRERGHPPHVYLNEFKESDYLHAFNAIAGLEVDEWLTTRTEGEGFLTREIELELADRYTREDLLKREVVVIGRRVL